MQRFIQPVLQFLKRHYEKIVLCLVLLGLAGAAIWMEGKIKAVQEEVATGTPAAAGHHKALEPIDISAGLAALSAVTNPPPVILSGDHNLFNPVTWRRKPNGELLKILQTGPEALEVRNLTPLYTVIDYDHPSGSGEVYVLAIQVHSAKKPPEYAKKDEKKKLYTIRGIKGAPDNPDELKLEIVDTGETVWISKGNPYKRVDGYVADLWYKPETKAFNKQHLNETITLDGEQYKIVEMTNNLIRVESISNGKVTPISWDGGQR
jgi:hypothetical protein